MTGMAGTLRIQEQWNRLRSRTRLFAPLMAEDMTRPLLAMLDMVEVSDMALSPTRWLVAVILFLAYSTMRLVQLNQWMIGRARGAYEEVDGGEDDGCPVPPPVCIA